MKVSRNFDQIKLENETYYKSLDATSCPYFGEEIIFNTEGWHHLQFSSGNERKKEEQILKFSLLKYVLQIIQKSGTIQEYRKTMGVVDRKKHTGEREMKIIQYWGLVAIIEGEKLQRIKVILRKVGTGPITFWSVMPDLKKNTDTFKFATGDVEEG